jgi:hypothetical protein
VARADAKLAQLLMAEEQRPRRQLRSSTRTKQVLAEQAARALAAQRSGETAGGGQQLAVHGGGAVGQRDARLQLPDFCDAEVAAANKLLGALYSVLQQEALRCHGCVAFMCLLSGFMHVAAVSHLCLVSCGLDWHTGHV